MNDQSAEKKFDIDSQMRAVIDAVGNTIEDMLPDCGFIVIVANSPDDGATGSMRYLSNLTHESRDYVLNIILDGVSVEEHGVSRDTDDSGPMIQ